jgi:cysteine-rich repeat protein
MKDREWGGVSAPIGALAGLSWTLALSSGCEGEHRPYELNSGGAAAMTNPAPTASGGAAGAGPEQAVSATPDVGPESTNINQLQPAPEMNAGSAAAECADGSTESCGPEQQQGICKLGTRTCTNGAWGLCIGAVLPAPRDCTSAEDNDCDGQPDNRQDDVCRCAADGKQACDEHPGLDGKGPCHAGEQACILGAGNSSSDWGPCTGAVGPSAADSCSVAGDDSTCDGTPNGGCPCVEGQMIACGPQTDNGICQRGTSTCQSGAFTPCQGAVFPARRDCSSAQDNDCDGIADNTIDATCQCIPGQGNGPCSADPSRSRCTAQGSCAPCQGDGDCSLVSGGRNLCRAGVCTAPRCGDGVVQPERGEECDDGGTAPGDGCTPDCRVAHAPTGASAFGGTHVCLLRANGSLTCWGTNNAGQLGTGRTDAGIVGATAVSGVLDAAQVAVGPSVTCAVRRNGRVACWGLGFTAIPTDIPNLTDVSEVAIASTQICMRRGTRVSCGTHDPGELYSTFVDVGLDSVTQVSAGNGQVCAVRSDGSLRCWGSNNAGQLGVGQPSNPVTTPTPSLATNVAEVSAGGETTCVRHANGSSECFGAGPLGSRTAPPFSATPVQVVNLPAPLRFASLTNNRCALLSDQSVRCWGSSPLGDADGLPIAIALPGRAVEIGAGSEVACAVLEDLSVYCWGTGLSILGLATSPAGAQVPVQLQVPAR